MKLAEFCFSAVFVAAGCIGGSSLAGGDDDPDRSTPEDGDDADGAPGDHATDTDSTPDIATEADGDAPPDADTSRDGRDVPASCGNGVLEYGEECDDGAANSDTRPDACRLACVAPVCGDGVVDTGERCDDGNRDDGDGCPASCFPDDEPPAAVEGDPVSTDDPFDTGGPPEVAWNGTGWGVAWGGRGQSHFAALDADAHPLAPAAALPFSGGITALAWSDGEYGIAFVSGWPSGEAALALLDPSGIVRAGPSWPPSAGDGIDLAWVPALGAWVAAYVGSTGGGSDGPILAVAADDHAGFLGTPVDLSGGEGKRGPVVVPTEARTVVAWSDDAGIWYRGLSWPDMTGEPDGRHLAGPLPSSDTDMGGAPYRTRAVLAWPDGERIRTVAIDGWSLDRIAEPAASGESRIADRTPELYAVPERGYLGLCYCDGRGPWGGGGGDEDRVVLRLVRPDGTPMGPEVIVRDGMRNAGGCAIGWSGTEFVVVYWWCGGDGEWNTVYAQRVRPVI